MSVPLELLTPLGGKALCFTVYGGPGLWKSHAIHTLPPPVLMLSFEDGHVSCLPWVRAMRTWSDKGWTRLDQPSREKIYTEAYTRLNNKGVMAMVEVAERVTPILPAPYIDVVRFDPTDSESYNQLVSEIANLDLQAYNSVAVDTLQELSAETQTFSRGTGQFWTTMSGQTWGGAQERAAMCIRKLQSYLSKGMFVYMNTSENIDKDYITDPRNQPKGQAESPYNVIGAPNVPGKLVPLVQHATDVLAHARLLNGKGWWVVHPEPITPGNQAVWQAKDRTGRIKDPYCRPNVRLILDQILGEETRRKIYGHGAAAKV